MERHALVLRLFLREDRVEPRDDFGRDGVHGGPLALPPVLRGVFPLRLGVHGVVRGRRREVRVRRLSRDLERRQKRLPVADVIRIRPDARRQAALLAVLGVPLLGREERPLRIVNFLVVVVVLGPRVERHGRRRRGRGLGFRVGLAELPLRLFEETRLFGIRARDQRILLFGFSLRLPLDAVFHLDRLRPVGPLVAAVLGEAPPRGRAAQPREVRAGEPRRLLGQVREARLGRGVQPGAARVVSQNVQALVLVGRMAAQPRPEASRS
mmetsp:Transcript_7132/g.22505  ORF Transcript_7132/g.22505 Transcript_7132/m.22505 type:complete len:267 (+) Transcript_7132:451-1251(+)